MHGGLCASGHVKVSSADWCQTQRRGQHRGGGILWVVQLVHRCYTETRPARLPFIMDLDQHRAHQTRGRGCIQEDANRIGAPLHFAGQRSDAHRCAALLPVIVSPMSSGARAAGSRTPCRADSPQNAVSSAMPFWMRLGPRHRRQDAHLPINPGTAQLSTWPAASRLSTGHRPAPPRKAPDASDPDPRTCCGCSWRRR